MSMTLPDPLLSRLSDFVAFHMGLSFPRERWEDLEKGIQQAAQDLQADDLPEFIQNLISSKPTPDHVNALAQRLTTGETYFFREGISFKVLEEKALPNLIRQRRAEGKRLRLWSAGCCTGEEPYSLAILLDQLLPDLPEWDIVIHATDINVRFLETAVEGRYGAWSFRGVPMKIREQYFQPASSGTLRIVPRLRRLVRFSCLNLADDNAGPPGSDPGLMDVVVCRNVLMYFVPEQARHLSRKLFASLVDGGWLLVGSAEASQTLFQQFITVGYPGAILYRKPDPPEHPPVIQARTENLDAPPPRQVTQPTAMKATPSYAPAAALIGRIHADRGRLHEALRWFERAVALDKVNPVYRYLKAMVLQETERVHEAVGAFQQALYLDPGFVIGHFALGSICRRMGRHAESERHFRIALSLLEACKPDDLVPESDGLTAGRLMEIIRAMPPQERRASEQ